MVITLLVIFLHSYHIAALEIKNLTILEKRMEVRNGARLLIPCYFKTNEHFKPRELLVEWGVSKLNYSYVPILRTIDTLVEPLLQRNDYENRAQMYLSRIRNGNCSLILNPILKTDTGRYEVRLSTIGEEEDHIQQVDVVVSEKNDTLHTSGPVTARMTSAKVNVIELIPEERTEEKEKEKEEEEEVEEDWETEARDANAPESLSKNEDPELIKFIMWMYFFLKKNRTSLIALVIVMLLLFTVFLLGTVAGLIFCYLYFKLKNQKNKDIEWTESSTPSTNSATEGSPLLTDHE